MDKPLLIAILGVALCLRIGAAVGIHTWLSQTGKIYLIEGDAEGYWALGKSIADGKPYQVYDPPRKVMRMPGYPLLIAGSLSIFGESRLAVRLLQAALSTLTVWLVMLLGAELIDPRTGLTSGAILAISPAAVGFTPLILSETLFACLLVLNLYTVATWIKAKESPRQYRGAILAGISAMLVVYVRPTWLPALLIWAVLAAIVRVGSQRWFESLVVLASGLICLMPWVYRNSQATGHRVLTTLWVGPSLYDSLNPESDGSSNMSFFDRENVMRHKGLTEYEMDRHYRERAKEFVSSHPGRACELMLAHAKRFWSFVPNAGQFQHAGLKWGLCLWSALFFSGGALGIWKLRSQWLALLCAFGPLVGFAIVHTVFVGSLRYRLPAEFPFSIAVAVGFMWIWDRSRRSAQTVGSNREVTA